MRIVSAGHMYDPDFLFRFYHLCSTHKYSAGTSFGSDIFYSIKSGCSFFFFLFDKIKISFVGDAYLLKRDLAPPPSPAQRLTMESLFSRPQPFVTQEQLKTVDYYLGAEYFKSVQELRKQLLYAEILDKIGFFVRNKEKVFHFVIPTYYRRAAQTWKRRLLRIWRIVLRLWKRTVKANNG